MVTAAHCVFDINDSLQYVSALDFMPGLNGGTAPYGTIDWKSVRVLSAFTSQVRTRPALARSPARRLVVWAAGTPPWVPGAAAGAPAGWLWCDCGQELRCACPVLQDFLQGFRLSCMQCCSRCTSSLAALTSCQL